MIVTTQKDFAHILSALGSRRKWVVAGCAECAAICQTGGSAQVDEMVRRLEEAGREVLAAVNLSSLCDRRLSRRDLQRVEGELANADGVLCLSCGGGVQAVGSVVKVPVVAALDAHFAGTVERLGVFPEECRLCGDCLLNETGGLCPEALCPKGLRNGPCEGSRAGRCEADAEAECVWERIFERTAFSGAILPLPDAGRWGRPRTTRKGGRP
jgi:Methylene-tetrahydrofolate reductase C terminal